MIIKCAQCGERNVMPKKLEPDVDYVCAKCKSVIYSKDTGEQITNNSNQKKLQTKYIALRTISTFIQILAYVVGIGGIIASILGASLIFEGTKSFAIGGTLGSLVFAIAGILGFSNCFYSYFGASGNNQTIFRY
jgi:hypothetical protein